MLPNYCFNIRFFWITSQNNFSLIQKPIIFFVTFLYVLLLPIGNWWIF